MGKRFSANLIPGDVVGLTGELGAGKTVFVQGIAEGLGVRARVNSPTFIILRNYDNARDANALIHVDLYRLEENLKNEITNLGLFDIIMARESVVVIEWAERIKDLLPDATKWVNLEQTENGRGITIQ